MHDYIISAYKVDLKNKIIQIDAEDVKQRKRSKFIAEGVLTHSFESVLEYNIILDIEEINIDRFIEDNISMLEEKRRECWPIDYQTIDKLKDISLQNEYKYIKIRCSYGLQGWILAKEYQIRKKKKGHLKV